VLTVEPGIYIPEEEIGVRIEDDLLVTDEGYLHLSAPLPRELEEIERIQAEPGLEERAARRGTTQIRQVR
ncbi:MAG: M24 family metallopeptidase, partial [Planctomycetota bacterium]|nr:M24 family metallopeptidase [Planctomycetota bacterium]